MKKKKTLAIFLAVAVAIASAILIVLMIANKPTVKFKDNLTFEAFSTVRFSDLIESCEHCHIDRDETIDSTQLGEKEIDVTLRSSFVYPVTFPVTVSFIDSEPPIIETMSNGRYIKLNGDANELWKGVTVRDNVDQEGLILSIEGDLDLTKPGKQHFAYTATDLSGNKGTLDSFVIVEIDGGEAKYFTTDKGFLGYEKNGLTYIDGVLVVNKTYSKPANYGNGLTAEFNAAFREMQRAASGDGISIYVVSGFRTYDYQAGLFEHFCNVEGVTEALRGSAKPGHSEHETGLAADLNYVDDGFKTWPAYRWLTQNCYKYGFILRYTENDEPSTGYYYEPWHYRYVGKELAEILWNGGDWICLEDYFGISSVYAE